MTEQPSMMDRSFPWVMGTCALALLITALTFAAHFVATVTGHVPQSQRCECCCEASP